VVKGRIEGHQAGLLYFTVKQTKVTLRLDLSNNNPTLNQSSDDGFLKLVAAAEIIAVALLGVAKAQPNMGVPPDSSEGTLLGKDDFLAFLEERHGDFQISICRFAVRSRVLLVVRENEFAFHVA